MLQGYWNRAAIVGGAVALLAVGAAPAGAQSVAEPCPITMPTTFTASTVTLGPESGPGDIWSSDLVLTAWCGEPMPGNELTGVAVVAVTASRSPLVPDLQASFDGSSPTTGLNAMPPTTFDMKNPVTGQYPLTDEHGQVTLRVRAHSEGRPFLAGEEGAPQVVGLHLDWAVGRASYQDAKGGTQDLPSLLVGGGSIWAATPELDSLALFATGAVGMAGYGMTRLRARRKN
jgi:hypothetical protein